MIPEGKVENKSCRQFASLSSSQRFSSGVQLRGLTCHEEFIPSGPTRSGASAESRDEDSRNAEVLQPKPAQTGEEGKLLNVQEPEPVHIDFVTYTHII